MEIKERKLTRKTVLIISLAAFLFVLVILATLSFVMNRGGSTSGITSSKIDKIESNIDLSDNSEISFDDISIDDVASQTFAESIIEESTEISDISNIEEETSVSEQELNHGWIINEYGYTYVYGDSGFEQFNFSNSTLERYANSLNSLVEYVPEKTRLFNITVPVSSTFVSIPREIYTADNFYNKSQSAFVSTVATKLNERITNIPIVPIIQEHYENGEYLFFRTDKNWTSLGAYIAYTSYCEASGITPYALNNFEEINIGDFLGSFYNATASNAMAENPDELICYGTLPSVKTALTVYDSGIVYTDFVLCGNKVSSKNAYNVYLGTIAERYEVNSTAEGGSLLIIGDSSVYPIVPFLASHYNKIDVIDPQYFETHINDFLSDHHYDEIITMCYSTNAISGNYIPSFNVITGVTADE